MSADVIDLRAARLARVEQSQRHARPARASDPRKLLADVEATRTALDVVRAELLAEIAAQDAADHAKSRGDKHTRAGGGQ